MKSAVYFLQVGILVSVFMCGPSEGRPSHHLVKDVGLPKEASSKGSNAAHSTTFFITVQPQPVGRDVEKVESNKWEVFSKIIESISGILTAAFTVVLGFSTVGLWRQTRNLADEARISSLSLEKIQQGILVLSREVIVKEGNKHGFPLVYKNIGASNISIEYFDHFGEDHAGFEKIKSSPLPIYLAGQALSNTSAYVGPSDKFGIGKYEIEESGKYIVGGVIYRDVFGKFKLCKVAVFVTRDGQVYAQPGVDFSLWEIRLAEMAATQNA